MDEILCSKCSSRFKQSRSEVGRIACPHCGSRARLFTKRLDATVSVRGGLRGIAYRISKSKWLIKFMSVPSFTASLGIWANRMKKEDKKSDEYLEIVTNPKNGEILHRCEEPLSHHQGHGSAKKNKVVNN